LDLQQASINSIHIRDSLLSNQLNHRANIPIPKKLNFSEKSKHNFKQNEIQNIYETPSTAKTFAKNK